MKLTHLHLVSSSGSDDAESEQRGRGERDATCPRCGSDLSLNGVKVCRRSAIVSVLAALGAYWVTVPSYRGRRVDGIITCRCGYRGSRSLGAY